MSIKEIAAMAGVSYSTVSRVLNDPEYKCSSREVRERILRAARELSYIPNESAKKLKLGAKKEQSPYKISLLVTRTQSADSDPFFRELTGIIESEIHKNMCIFSQIRYHPVLSDRENTDKREIEKTVKEMCEDCSDGLIIIGKCDAEVIKSLKRIFKAVVSVNRNSTNYEVDEVLCDGRKIAALAIEYLIKLGHRKIGYVGDCRGESRFQGYGETLFKYNIDIDADFIFETQQSEECGYETMEALIRRKNVPTALYCANDITAVGMIKALSKYKNRYYNPSIISGDDINEAQFTKPMLTTVHLPKEDMAKFALYLLLDRLNGGHKTTARVELEGSLVIRESCSEASAALNCEYYI